MSRQVSVVYHIAERGKAAFGLRSDVEFTTYFETPGSISGGQLLELLPKGTKVLVLHPEEQRNVRSDGIVVKGIAYSNKEDLLADVKERSRILVDLFNDNFQKRSDGDYERIYRELERSDRTIPTQSGDEGDAWTISEIELP